MLLKPRAMRIWRLGMAEMKRSIERWQFMNPKAVMEGSLAQIQFCIEDAQCDILFLDDRVKELEAKLRRQPKREKV